MTDRVDRGPSGREHTPRIRSWHAPERRDRAAAVFAADARTRRLARLVPLWPSEIESSDISSAKRVVAALERALRGERRRGRAGHWTYDMNRHMALSRALREERARLESLRQTGTAKASAPRRPKTSPVETKSIPLSPI